MNCKKSSGYLGIDPGNGGGLSLIYLKEDRVTLSTYSMPETERDIYELVQSIKSLNSTTFCLIEKVSGYIGEGHPGSRMFTFGYNYGLVRMALVACEIAYVEIRPQEWQKIIGIAPRRSHKEGRKKIYDENTNQFKNRLKAKAQQLFPDNKITLKTSDSALIAECCRRLRRSGEL